MSIKQAGKSLLSRHNPLSNTFYQLDILNATDSHVSDISSFEATLKNTGHPRLLPTTLEILQVNVGKLCNQSCGHCHVDAGPDRTEVMSQALMQKCLEIISTYSIRTVDITGGAPELNPYFKWFVEECRKLDCQVINRCNLTIIVSNPKYNDLPNFFAEHQVQVICSLPHFNKLRTDRKSVV